MTFMFSAKSQAGLETASWNLAWGGNGWGPRRCARLQENRNFTCEKSQGAPSAP